MEAVEAEVGADALLVLFGDVETQEHLPVAVDRQLAEEAAHVVRLLAHEDGLELPGRRMDGLREELVVGVGAPAHGLAPLGEEEVARGAAKEAGEPGGLLEDAAPK